MHMAVVQETPGKRIKRPEEHPRGGRKCKDALREEQKAKEDRGRGTRRDKTSTSFAQARGVAVTRPPREPESKKMSTKTERGRARH